MPTFRHGDATLYYEEFGQGFPILTFAPAGLQSTIEVWSRPAAPINPTTELAAGFRVIAMDQRNAGGRSHAPITAREGWPTYTADHLATDHPEATPAVLDAFSRNLYEPGFVYCVDRAFVSPRG
jgi:pimeloyl-ACP methyl ester carboxylesterase